MLRYQEEPKNIRLRQARTSLRRSRRAKSALRRALGEDDKELGAGSVTVTLTRNIGMPQSVEGVTVSGDTLRWTAEESAVSYTVEAVKNGAVVKTESGVTATELDLTSLALGAGKYEMRVSGVNSANVKGTAGSDYYLVKGDSGFLTETATGSGEYYLCRFPQAGRPRIYRKPRRDRKIRIRNARIYGRGVGRQGRCGIRFPRRSTGIPCFRLKCVFA
ncbi:MAG: hypothetical protein ACLUSP_06190 [Christensenellales bacterium]